MSYPVGSAYRSSVVVTDATGTPASPATKNLTITLPDQTTSMPAIIADSGTGAFHADYVFTQEGLHKFAWTATGPTWAQTDYASAAEFRSVIGTAEARTYIGETDTSRDPILRMVMASLTEKAESIVGTCVQRRIVNETISGDSADVIRLKRSPLPSETAVESVVSRYPGGPSWSNTDPVYPFIVYPDSGTVELVSMLPFWRGPWHVTYTAGRLVIPEGVQLAVKEMLIDFWASQRPYGVDDLEPGPDDTARWEAALAAYDIPPHAKALLEAEEMPGFA